MSGRVQGVFFRDSCAQQAKQLKLSGGVRNLRDGRVEVQVAGIETAVEALIKWLETGPKHAKVSIIEVIDITVTCVGELDMLAENSHNRLTPTCAGQFFVLPTK